MKYSRWTFVETFVKKKKYSNKYLFKLFLFSWMLKLFSHQGNLWITHAVCVCMCLKAFHWITDTCRMLEIDESKCGASISESPACKLITGVILHQILNLKAAFTYFIAIALSITFILFQKTFITENWNADIEQKKKAVTFTSCSLCSYVLGKKIGNGTKELSYHTEEQYLDLQTKTNRVCASGMRAERQDGILSKFCTRHSLFIPRTTECDPHGDAPFKFSYGLTQGIVRRRREFVHRLRERPFMDLNAHIWHF